MAINYLLYTHSWHRAKHVIVIFVTGLKVVHFIRAPWVVKVGQQRLDYFVDYSSVELYIKIRALQQGGIMMDHTY